MIKELILSNTELQTLTSRVDLSAVQPGDEFVSIIDRSVLRVTLNVTNNVVHCIKVMDLYFNPIPEAKQKQVRVWYSSGLGENGCWEIADFKHVMQTKLQSLLANF